MKIAVINSSSFGKRFPEHHKALQSYGEVNDFKVSPHMTAKKLAKLLNGYEIIISSVTPFFTEEFFELKDELKLITRHGIGYNNIDIKAATKHGVAVTNVPAVIEREAVAEHTVALLLSLVRQVVPASQKVKAGKWSQRATCLGYELKEKTMGIIGFGNIGSRVGEILKDGFNMKLLAYDPYIPAEQFETIGAKSCELTTLLQESDFISFNAMVTEESFHMISDKEFSLMKDGVYLVNTARGELLNEAALVRALEANKIAGIAMDVVEGEPIDQDHCLLNDQNVLMTPHISAYTEECLKGMGDKVVSDVRNILNHAQLNNLVNPEVLK